ncbi:AraC family transcriptional regulator [Bacillus massiliigorillae]|uniref:AraC family transcriptional regulator n=1 Tax=Bacillus massiliigorillae TaxID=1243664 RepID=UPI00039F3825|nr:AraC family transcriptional regulator [Bacillus massiliigorillae]
MNSYKKKSELKLFNELNQTFFRIHRIDENIRPSNWKIHKVDRPYSVFWYVVSGKKIVRINNEEYIVRGGDLVIFPSEISFEIEESKTFPPMHHLEIAFENKLGSFDLVRLYKFPIVTNLNEYDKRTELVDYWREMKKGWTPEIKNLYTTKNGEFELALNQTIQLLQLNAITLHWFVEILTLLQPYAEELLPTIDSRLQHLFYFIDDHIEEKLTLYRLAKEVYISESHLSLLFRKNIKMSPIEYVRHVRLQKARELLLTTDLSLMAISEMIGFSSQTQLSRAFREMIGVSPMEYRKNGNFI